MITAIEAREMVKAYETAHEEKDQISARNWLEASADPCIKAACTVGNTAALVGNLCGLTERAIDMAITELKSNGYHTAKLRTPIIFISWGE